MPFSYSVQIFSWNEQHDYMKHRGSCVHIESTKKQRKTLKLLRRFKYTGPLVLLQIMRMGYDIFSEKMIIIVMQYICMQDI